MDKISPKLLPRSLLPRRGVIEQDKDEKPKTTFQRQIFVGRHVAGAEQAEVRLQEGWQVSLLLLSSVHDHDLAVVVLIGQIHSLS